MIGKADARSFWLTDGLGGTVHEEVAKELGMAFVPELFVDIEYSKEGALIPPAQSKKITPQESAERARKVAETGNNYAQGGGEVNMPEFGMPTMEASASRFRFASTAIFPERKVEQQSKWAQRGSKSAWRQVLIVLTSSSDCGNEQDSKDGGRAQRQDVPWCLVYQR